MLQPDVSYKWELVEPTQSEMMGNGPEAPAVCPAPEPKATKKKSAKNKTTSPLTE